MPRYEYRCRSCGDTFELRRAMAESDAPAACPAGHTDTTKLLSVFASVGASAPGGGAVPSPAPTGGGGGCCGGGCGCH